MDFHLLIPSNTGANLLTPPFSFFFSFQRDRLFRDNSFLFLCQAQEVISVVLLLFDREIIKYSGSSLKSHLNGILLLGLLDCGLGSVGALQDRKQQLCTLADFSRKCA